MLKQENTPGMKMKYERDSVFMTGVADTNISKNALVLDVCLFSNYNS